MYKTEKKLAKSKQIVNLLKRKLLVIITAFMLGMSNSINKEDKSIFDNNYSIEQRDEK